MKFLDETENDSPFNNLQRGWVLPYYKTDINSTTWIGKRLDFESGIIIHTLVDGNNTFRFPLVYQ